MTYQLEAVYSDGKKEAWKIRCDSLLLASQEAEESARRLGEKQPVTVYLFDSKGVCLSHYTGG